MSPGQRAGTQRESSVVGEPEREGGGDVDLGEEGTSQAHVDDAHQSAATGAAGPAADVVEDILVSERRGGVGG